MHKSESPESLTITRRAETIREATGCSWEYACKRAENERDGIFLSQAAREAASSGYGDTSYWAYLDDAALRTRDYFTRHGDPVKAAEMMARGLGEALMGNDGD